jgi:hypothetical protein
MFNTASPSLADIAAVTDRNDGDGWGNGGWWVLIILFALFGGWGGNGYGNNANNAVQTAATQADIQRGFDTQSVIQKLDGLNSGVCSLGYDQLAQMNSIQQNVMQNGYETRNAVQQSSIDNMQNTNALQAQLSNCCCENREAVSNLRFDLAQSTCRLENEINATTQNIMTNCNNNYRQLHDEIIALRLEDKNEKIQEQSQQIQALRLAASQCAQNEYLVGQLRPSPVPAFPVANPYTYSYPYANGFNSNGCGCCTA